MYGTREFRFSYTDKDGETKHFPARNEWLARRTVEQWGCDPKTVKRAPLNQSKQPAGTHCQICGREIQAKTGLIAHHGYTRPGHGWQTASCFGARWRPYEVACDALPPAIESLQDYITGTESRIVHRLSSPPAWWTYDTNGKYSHAKRSYDKITVTLERPAGFDPQAEVKRHYGERTYADEFSGQIATWRMHADNAKSDLKRLKKRLADWKAPK